jgi:hypothetical protein
MLFGSTMLEVAIGLVFVYLLLSLLCSAFNELINAALKLRAKDLEKGIRRLLSTPELAAGFFEHPLIKPLYENRKPSYIPARTFSLALWNMATAAAERTRRTAGEQTGLVAGVTKDLRLLRETILTLPPADLPADLKQSLVTLIDEADNDFDKARANVERWYDDAMDRVSGAFKRRTQYILLGLGFTLALVMNADTFGIVRALANNADLRRTVVAAAESYAKEPLPGAAGGEATAQFEAARERIRNIKGEIDQLGLPLGWKGAPSGALGWPTKLAGILLTALAISQGAPFWFDLLNKFIVIRSTVKPREKSQEQPSKDRPAPDAKPKGDGEPSKG